MKKEPEIESPLIKKLTPENRGILTRTRALLKANKIKSISDAQWSRKALDDLKHSGELHESTIAWLAALVSRDGAEFKPKNDEEVIVTNSQK